MEGGEEEAGEEEQAAGPKILNTYKIYGTLKNPENFTNETKTPEYVKEIIKVFRKSLILINFAKQIDFYFLDFRIQTRKAY